MKVCILNHDMMQHTGAGRFGASLLTGLRKSDPGIEVAVLTSVASGHDLELAVIPSNKLRLLFALPRIRKILRQADIIHALDGYPYGLVAVLASLGLKKKIIITAIGTGAIQPLYRWWGSLLVWTYRRADFVAAISGYTRREILKKVPNLKIEVVNHAVDAGEFQGDLWAGVGAELRARIEKLKPFILSVGAPKERKGFRFSLSAFKHVAEKLPNMNYLIIGTEGGTWQKMAKDLGVGDRVFFIKQVPRKVLTAIYRSAKLFILLPYDVGKDVEGFGFVFLEAAAAGLPVVGTYDSGAEDAIVNGHNGFLVRPCDPEAAARAVMKIFESPELRQTFSANSLAFARRMNWLAVGRRYLDIYHKLKTLRS